VAEGVRGKGKMSVKKRILIKGKKVHNVGYRPFLMEKAQELKIPYFHAKNVKDKEDGKQVVDARVGGEEGRIDNFQKFVHKNWPEHAEVESITVEEREYEDDIMGIGDFSRVLSGSQLSKIVQTGLGMIEMQMQALGKQDQTLGKQDQTLEKQDQTIAIIKNGNEMLATKQDQMLEKQDVMIGKQEQTISIMRSGVDEMREFRTETQQNFANLDTTYGKIAENMERILEELKEERKEYRESIEKLVTAILESKRGD
jgi:acylphosphatase